MITSLQVKNFTAFSEARLDFGEHLNVIVGENGTGKTHLLKLAYSVLAASWEEGRKPNAPDPAMSRLGGRLGDKLVNVFRCETLGHLTRQSNHPERCEVRMACESAAWDISFSFSDSETIGVAISTVPASFVDAAPIYLPTRELLSIYPGFVSLYASRYLEFEETWYDTCILLGLPLKKGVEEKRVRELLEPLEKAMGGAIELDKTGRFYFHGAKGRLEMPLVAEGLRKLGMLARLIATGALLDNGCLFWDEPEANLNPSILRNVASSIVELSLGGIQVFIATHSLFLMRELHILQKQASQKLDVRYFGLHRREGEVEVLQGPDMADIGDVAALDEDLEQSDRYIDVETGAAFVSRSEESDGAQ